jgi:glycosyltransferase involved in cell wall biosynthesis
VVKICSLGRDGDIAKLRRSPFGRGLWALLRRASTFTVPTPALVADLLGAGVRASRIAVIPNVVAPAPDAPSRAAARARIGLPDRPTALFVGRLVPGKGLDVLSRAWDRVAESIEATLVIVGGGPEARGLAEWARASRHAGFIHLVGERTDVDPFYHAADVLVAPSRAETFGNVVAEAMVRGLAVLTTPVGLAAHWVRHEDNAIVVRGEDPEGLSAALGRLLRDAPLRARLGTAARRMAMLSFAPDAIVEQYVDLYGRLVDGGLAALI